MSWTTIPRWLYENDLPDGELQAFYVKAARKKLTELLQERRELDEQILQAKVFLSEAAEALARYQGPPRGRRLPGG